MNRCLSCQSEVSYWKVWHSYWDWRQTFSTCSSCGERPANRERPGCWLAFVVLLWSAYLLGHWVLGEMSLVDALVVSAVFSPFVALLVSFLWPFIAITGRSSKDEEL